MKKRMRMIAAVLAGCLLTASVLSGCSTIGKLSELAESLKSNETETTAAASAEETTAKETAVTKAATEAATEATTEEKTGEKNEESTEEASAETAASASETVPVTEAGGSAFDTSLGFQRFTDQVFASLIDGSTLNIHFYLTDPEAFGLDPTLATWGDAEVTEDSADEYRAYLDDVMNCLMSFEYDTLDSEEKLVYDMLKDYVETEYLCVGYDLYYEPLGPNTGLQAEIPIYLAEYAFYTEQDVINYLSMLDQLPAYFESILVFEQQKADAGLFMEDALLENVISQCEAFIEGEEESFLYENFNEKLEALELDKEVTDDYEAQNDELVRSGVYEAYRNLVEGLEKLRGSGAVEGGLCNYPGGDEYYAYLIRSNVGTSRTPEELIEWIDETMDSGILDLQLMYRMDPDVLEELESFEFPSSDPEEIMQYLITACEDDFPALDEVDYTISYVDESLRDYLSPACYFIPPVDDNTVNSILINCDPGDEAEDIFLTMSHEGYPGHLYQTNYVKENSDMVLHQLLSTNGFVEGWAEYVELNGYGLVDGTSATLTKFAKCNDLITLCIYGRADLGVHYEGWDSDDVYDLVSYYFGDIDKEVGKWIYEYVLGDPGGYLDYLVGSMEIMDIREEAEKSADFEVKEFHRQLLDLSGASFDIIRKYMFE